MHPAADTAGARSGPRVVVTGIGLLTALTPAWRRIDPRSGALREGTWRSVLAGQSAARLLEPAHAGRPGLLGCALHPEYPVEREYLDQLLYAVADEAIADAGLDPHSHASWNVDPSRAGVLLGLSKGALRRMAQAADLAEQGGDIARLWPGCWPSHGAAELSRRYGLQGPAVAPIAACATGLVAAIQAIDLLRSGRCDLVLAGSVDASIEPLVMSAFRAMKVLAFEADHPKQAMRPWDRQRRGFLVGEGGAVLVLEREPDALARGARPYCELAGGALGSDAYHSTDLDPNPARLTRLIQRALANAHTQSSDIDLVHVHGTATRSNDPLECRAIRGAFGSHADSLSCSASKPQIGHLLGAAGAAELALACLALRDQVAPPTINLRDPDPACNLDATPELARPRRLRAALKLSLGFGGHLAAAVLREVENGRPPSLGTETLAHVP